MTEKGITLTITEFSDSKRPTQVKLSINCSVDMYEAVKIIDEQVLGKTDIRCYKLVRSVAVSSMTRRTIVKRPRKRIFSRTA